MITISSLQPTDWATAYQIETRSHAYPWSEQTFNANQGERFNNLCATDSTGKLLGFAICQVVLDEASLFNLAVDADSQRQGVGRQLLTALIAQLITRDVLTLWLEVRASNSAAIALYQSLEFNQVSCRRDYYPMANGYEDALLMALTL